MSEKEGSGGQGMKKGPWTAAEDAILAEYVQKHGEGNWNSVQKNSGLMRCGKSCRLRWANHLRPNLKKGAFSPEEERTIIELHAKLGNKWARMAAQLPGRTDNEIKNYWNTRLKRRQRAGLPIYPQENIREEATPAFCHHVQQQQFHRDPFDQLLAGRKRPISCCSPPNSSLPPSQRQKTSGHTTYNFSPNNFTFDTYGNHHPIIPSYINNTNNNLNFQYCDRTNHTDKGRLVFPLSQVPSFSTALYGTNQNLDGQFSPPCDDGLSYSSLLMGGISLPHDSTNYCNDKDQRNGACLDEFLMGSQSLFGDAQSNTDMVNEKDRNVYSTGSKQGEAASEEMNSMDDDLSSLLTNFPSATPLPDWYTGNRIASAGGPFPDNPTQDSAIAVNTSSSHLASANWKNMPGIC